MKLSRVIVVLLLFVTSACFAQQPPVRQPAPQHPAQQQSASQAKRPPQAKTQAEYADYNASYALSGGAAVEKAANEFAAKYPDSELKSFLFSKAMHEYQNENNPNKMLSMGDKVLSLDPDNTIALVLTATVLSDNLTDGDPERSKKILTIKQNAARALETVNTSFAPPAGARPEQVAAYKKTLESMAHSALGIMNLKVNDDPGAERELKLAAELNVTQPDPYIWYHLALAQDHQKKYMEALASVEKALKYAGANSELTPLATAERERLAKLSGSQQNNQPN
jgi:tetratricopeptide (TPR) repeat protein